MGNDEFIKKSKDCYNQAKDKINNQDEINRNKLLFISAINKNYNSV